MVRHYRTLLSHPAVEAITYWGLSDAGAWLGAPVGFVRSDATPKPSYDALRALVKGEWWLSPATMTTDDDGRVAVTGFLGEYEISTPAGVATFELGQPGALVVEARLPA
jgi:hypothetical protein